MKILYVMTSLGNGGVEKMIMSWILGFNKEQYHIDIIAQGIESEENKRILEEAGCNVYNMPFRYREINKRKKFLETITRANRYDIIHVHTCTALDYLCLKIAKKNNIPVRIVHSHSSGLGTSNMVNLTLHMISRPLLRKYATALFACSTEAGLHLFGEKGSGNIYYIPNGIDTNRYRYSKSNRQKIREQYKIAEDTLVLGCVGRYDPQKNQDFVVKILKCLLDSSRIMCHLFLIGDGRCRVHVEEEINRLQLNEFVTLISYTDKVEEYLSAMDIMVFPSEREGLSVALVEAQCNGLFCITSNHISPETKMTQQFISIPVEDNAVEWKNLCLNMYSTKSHFDRLDGYEQIRKCGYDIHDSTNKIMSLYKNFLNAK